MRARDVVSCPVTAVRPGPPVEEAAGGHRRWRVDVRDGIVTIGDQFDAATDRHVATVLAESVPGVGRATAFADRDEDDR